MVFHLVRNRHSRIAFGSSSAQCSTCSQSNIFKLSFVKSADNFAISCTECCADESTLFISSRTLSHLPSPSSLLRRSQLELLEQKLSLPRILLRSDPQTYVETLVKLINAERDKEKEIKEQMRQENITLRFDGQYCYFHFNSPTNGFRMNIGDEVKFTHKTGISFTGTVCEDQFTEELKVQIAEGDYPRTGYSVEYIWNGVCYKRMRWALRKLFSQRKKNVLLPYVLYGEGRKGKPAAIKNNKNSEKSGTESDKLGIEKDNGSNEKNNVNSIEQLTGSILEPAGFCKLNDAQRIAVSAAMTRQLTLIQGPPGTGKTIVSAAIVYNLVKQFKKKVLVVAPSNTAVDQLAIQINNTGLKVLRVVSRRRECHSNEADFLCLHTLLREFNEPETAKRALLRSADVVCCTCVTAGQQLFNDFSFPFVLIDEAVQSTEPLSLIPCAYGASKLIMVGDHKQLGPTILCEEAAKAGLRRSLFERLIQIGIKPFLLNTQYRMHPDLCMFPSEYFYDGQLRTGAVIPKRLDFPTNFFYVCHGKEEVSQSGTSFLNRAEALMVENVIRFLFKKGVREQQIGVITPYEGQRSYILGSIFGNEPGNLEIANVDAFQGREKDFIIVSLVRSNSFNGIGFVADKRRMNVALTRAKYGLAIVGNPFTFSKNKMWNELLRWYDEQGNVYEGPVGALRRTSLGPLDSKEVEYKEAPEIPS